VICDPEDDCHDAACDPLTGTCLETPKPDGRLCDDGDACTVVDTCVAGQCQAGNERSCDDFDPCTGDSCDPASGCVFDAFTSFASVSCAFDPTRIATFCFEGLPRAIERRIEHADTAVQHAAEATKTGRARKLLKHAANLSQQAERRAAKQTEKETLSPACGTALQDVLVDVAARALALRDALVAN
jgi:hypothetical protein